MNARTRRSPVQLQELLHADHERLHELFKTVINAFCSDTRELAARLWDEFDARLENHLTLEEELIFPLFAERYPEEESTLRDEHAALRSQLLEMGAGVDLHLTRATAVIRFIGELEAHAQREDALLYAWAAEHLPAAIQDVIDARLRRAPEKHSLHQEPRLLG